MTTRAGALKAIFVPSGDQAGPKSNAPALESGRGAEPPSETTQMREPGVSLRV